MTVTDQGKAYVLRYGVEKYGINLYMALFTAPAAPTVATIYSAFVRAGYTGYSDATNIFQSSSNSQTILPAMNASGDQQIDGNLCQWNPPASGSPTNIYGIMLGVSDSDAPSGNVIIAYQLLPSAPVAFGPGSAPIKYYISAIMGQLAGYP